MSLDARLAPANPCSGRSCGVRLSRSQASMSKASRSGVFSLKISSSAGALRFALSRSFVGVLLQLRQSPSPLRLDEQCVVRPFTEFRQIQDVLCALYGRVDNASVLSESGRRWTLLCAMHSLCKLLAAWSDGGPAGDLVDMLGRRVCRLGPSLQEALYIACAAHQYRSGLLGALVVGCPRLNKALMIRSVVPHGPRSFAIQSGAQCSPLCALRPRCLSSVTSVTLSR